MEMADSALEQGTALQSIWGPAHEAGQSGAAAGYNGVASIMVHCLAGPMGWYDVAVIEFDGDRQDEIIPLHMAESITLA